MQLAPGLPHCCLHGAICSTQLTARLLPQVPLFFCLATICYLDRANLAYAALELLQDLQFTETIYSIGAGVSSLCNASLWWWPLGSQAAC